MHRNGLLGVQKLVDIIALRTLYAGREISPAQRNLMSTVFAQADTFIGWRTVFVAMFYINALFP